jgi:hypothetical protein
LGGYYYRWVGTVSQNFRKTLQCYVSKETNVFECVNDKSALDDCLLDIQSAFRGIYPSFSIYEQSLYCEWNKCTCASAAESGHGMNINCASAARSGFLDVLKWARSNGYPWDKKTYENATSKNHWNVARWAVENGCPTL